MYLPMWCGMWNVETVKTGETKEVFVCTTGNIEKQEKHPNEQKHGG